MMSQQRHYNPNSNKKNLDEINIPTTRNQGKNIIYNTKNMATLYIYIFI